MPTRLAIPPTGCASRRTDRGRGARTPTASVLFARKPNAFATPEHADLGNRYSAVAIVSRARSIWFCGERPTSFQPGSEDARPDEGFPALPGRPGDVGQLADRAPQPVGVA